MSGTSNDCAPVEGGLQFLTDSAYSALLDSETSNWPASTERRPQDGLFMERLESFIDGQLKDIEAFANREQRPVDEVRRLVAIPHAKYIFSLDPCLPSADNSKAPTEQPVDPLSLKSILYRLSGMLQFLHVSSGLDSLLLVVSPRAPAAAPPPPPLPAEVDASKSPPTKKREAEPVEVSWIGGTELGKEFWMGLKGGGLNGARAFRIKSQMRLEEAELRSEEQNVSDSAITPPPASTPNAHLPAARMTSADVKTELNAAVRQALRAASGNPSAEMRWTKPASLEELYDVQLIGWPPEIDMRNPSNNSLKQNRTLLRCIRTGKMRFVKRGSPGWIFTSRPPIIVQHRVTDTNSKTHSGAASNNTQITVPPNAASSSSKHIPSLPSTSVSGPSHIPADISLSSPSSTFANAPHVRRTKFSRFILSDTSAGGASKRLREDNACEPGRNGREPKRAKVVSSERRGKG